MAESLYTTETPASETTESPGPTLGTVIVIAVAGQITALKWYCPTSPPDNAASLPFVLYDAGTHSELGRTTATVTTGWNTATLGTPVSVTAGQRVIAAVYTANRYTYTSGYWSADRVVGNLTGVASANDSVGNGRFHTGSDAYPESTFGSNNYWTDVVFTATAGGTVSPTGLAITKALGTPTVAQTLTAAPTGLAVSTALGTPAAVNAMNTASPTGLNKTVALGTPTVSQTLTVSPTGIAIPVVAGTPSLTMLAGSVTAAGIAVPVSLGQPTVSGQPYVQQLTGGSWWELESILSGGRSLKRYWETVQPIACPNDGEPLKRSMDGILYCPFDNWRPYGQQPRRIGSGGRDWGKLGGIKQAAARDAAINQLVLSCPNDGEPLSIGADGTQYCRWDGWMPPV